MSDYLIPVTGAAEGPVDEAILRRLIAEAGGQVSSVHGMHGKSSVRLGLRGYNNAARFAPWVVLVDLDRDAECAPPLVEAWLSQPAPQMCFRVAVREAEAWLLADGRGIAAYLGVPVSRVPLDPDRLVEPKGALVALARQSRRRAVREEMVPRAGGGRAVGPVYTSRLIEFVEGAWSPERAAGNSDSLRRCRDRIRELIARQ